jgi:hypothetical protein
MSRKRKTTKSFIVAAFAIWVGIMGYLIHRENEVESDFDAYLIEHQCKHVRDPIVDCNVEQCSKGEKLRPKGEVTQPLYFCHANGERMTFRLFKREKANEGGL